MCLTLAYTMTLKQSTKVFLSHMALSNLSIAVLLLLKVFFGIFEVVVPVKGCLVWVVIYITGFLSYMTTQIFMYMDLYLSTRMMKMTPLISLRQAIVMCVLCWVGWMAIGSVTIVWVNPVTYNVSFEYGHCSLNREIVTWKASAWYTFFSLANLIILSVLYIMLYKLLEKKFSEISPGQAGGMNYQWLTKHQEIFRSMRIQLIIVIVCWGVTTLGANMHVMITHQSPSYMLTDSKKRIAFYFMLQFIYTVPLYSNNIIFLRKSKALRNTMGSFIARYCRCHRNKVAPLSISADIEMQQIWWFISVWLVHVIKWPDIYIITAVHMKLLLHG